MKESLKEELDAIIHYGNSSQSKRHARYTGLGYGFGLAFVAAMLGLVFLLRVTP